MKEAYGDPPKFQAKTLRIIQLCDEIVTEYMSKGLRLTVRQLYYQLVARGHIENTVKSYDNILVAVGNARMAGLIDWEGIEDRTRGFISNPHWLDGPHIMRSAASSFQIDMWENQEYRLFAVVEKEALAGVLEGICAKWDIPLLPSRGYSSLTTLRDFAKGRIMGQGQKVVILHLGDHDPSGIDMSRDLEDRLRMFSRDTVDFHFERIALNMDQVRKYNPPANPAKTTDGRFESYRQQFGVESWELDALQPEVMMELISRQADDYIDEAQWQSDMDRVAVTKARILELSGEY